jgi:hypothetical protein
MTTLPRASQTVGQNSTARIRRGDGPARGAKPARQAQATSESVSAEAAEWEQSRKFWRYMFELQLAWETGDALALAKGLVASRFNSSLPLSLPLWVEHGALKFIMGNLPPAERGAALNARRARSIPHAKPLTLPDPN